MITESEKFEKKKVTISLDKWIIEPAKEICRKLGLPFDTAINIYLYQLVYTRGVPFPVVLPSQDVLDECELYRKLAAGEEDVKAGRLIPADEAFARIRMRLDEEIRKKEEDENKGDQ